MNNRPICIIKVGSAVVTAVNGSLDVTFLEDVCRQAVELTRLGWSPIIVSSGAKAAGLGVLNSHHQDRQFLKEFENERRILSAIGQAQLIMTYAKFFDEYNKDIISSQILLTRESLSDWRRHKIIRDTLSEMLNRNIIPIINNNDSARDPGIDFIDNDQLAVYLATALDVELVIFVSDSGGVFDKNPKLHDDAKCIDELLGSEWPEEIAVDDRGSSFGGMKNKLEALRVLATFGIRARVAAKSEKDIIVRSVTMPTSRFGTRLTPTVARKIGGKARFKRWIATSALPSGMIIVSDPGAGRLKDKDGGKSISLLAVGVIGHHGVFTEGDTIALLDAKYQIIAIGRTRVSSTGLPNLMSSSVSRIVVHADQMVLATEAGFCVANLSQFIRASVSRIRSDGFDVLDSRGGMPPGYSSAVIRLGNRQRSRSAAAASATRSTAVGMDVALEISDDEVLLEGMCARLAWQEAQEVSVIYGCSLDDWLLFRGYSS